MVTWCYMILVGIIDSLEDQAAGGVQHPEWRLVRPSFRSCRATAMPDNSTPPALARLMQAAATQHFVMERVPESTVYRLSLAFFRPATGRRDEPRCGMMHIHYHQAYIHTLSINMHYIHLKHTPKRDIYIYIYILNGQTSEEAEKGFVEGTCPLDHTSRMPPQKSLGPPEYRRIHVYIHTYSS